MILSVGVLRPTPTTTVTTTKFPPTPAVSIQLPVLNPHSVGRVVLAPIITIILCLERPQFLLWSDGVHESPFSGFVRAAATSAKPPANTIVCSIAS